MATRDHFLDDGIIQAAYSEFLAYGFQKASLHKIAEKVVYRDCFIICLAVGGRKNATMPVLLFNFLSQCILWQGERLFRAGELVYAA